MGGGFGREMDTCMNMYGWSPLLSIWNYHNIVNRLYSNTKLKVKKIKWSAEIKRILRKGETRTQQIKGLLYGVNRGTKGESGQAVRRGACCEVGFAWTHVLQKMTLLWLSHVRAGTCWSRGRGPGNTKVVKQGCFRLGQPASTLALARACWVMLGLRVVTNRMKQESNSTLLPSFLEASDSGAAPGLLFPGIPRLWLLSWTMQINYLWDLHRACLHPMVGWTLGMGAQARGEAGWPLRSRGDPSPLWTASFESHRVSALVYFRSTQGT